MYEQFDTLIIEPDMGARMRLKQASISVPTFGKLLQVSTTSEGEQKIAGPEKVDIVFISCAIPQAETMNFIKKCKASPRGQDAAYVLVLRTQDQDGSSVATNILVGADGLLYEPYSVDSLVEIARLASKVKGERAQQREEAAIRYLMTEITDQISIIAHLKAMKLDSARQFKKLKEMCAIFDSLDADTKEKYLMVAVDVFEKAPLTKAPEHLPQYGGVSERIRKRLEEKVVAKLKTNPEAK